MPGHDRYMLVAHSNFQRHKWWVNDVRLLWILLNPAVHLRRLLSPSFDDMPIPEFFSAQKDTACILNHTSTCHFFESCGHATFGVWRDSRGCVPGFGKPTCRLSCLYWFTVASRTLLHHTPCFALQLPISTRSFFAGSISYFLNIEIWSPYDVAVSTRTNFSSLRRGKLLISIDIFDIQPLCHAFTFWVSQSK